MSITKNKNRPKIKDAIYETYLDKNELENELGKFIKVILFICILFKFG